MSQPQSSMALDLCVRITQAEYAGDRVAALALARQAWDVAGDALDRCAAAHYVARFLADPSDRLHWNKIALDEAGRAAPDLVAPWLPSLYVNLGRAYEALGDREAALACYARARALGLSHDPDGPAELHTVDGSA